MNRREALAALLGPLVASTIPRRDPEPVTITPSEFRYDEHIFLVPRTDLGENDFSVFLESDPRNLTAD